MNKKIQCLRQKFRSSNLDSILIANPKNIYYLTGIIAEGILILNDKDNIFLTDARYSQMLKNTLTIYDEITIYDRADLEKNDYINFLDNSLNVGFEENYLTYDIYEKYKKLFGINNFCKASHLIENERLIKDDDEIEKIAKACKITDECYYYILKIIKSGMTEKDIDKLIRKYFIDNSDGISFDPIVASGKNSSYPHATVTNKVIAKGDIVTIDMGCLIDGYCSDMTRTFFIEELDKTYEYVYNIVRYSQEKSLLEIKDGVSIKQIAQNVEDEFKKHGFNQAHSLGHGVGLSIHEDPIINFNVSQNSIFKENMVITSEPGIYLPGKFGVRIEDTIVVSKKGAISLCNSPKDIIVVNNN